MENMIMKRYAPDEEYDPCEDCMAYEDDGVEACENCPDWEENKEDV